MPKVFYEDTVVALFGDLTPVRRDQDFFCNPIPEGDANVRWVRCHECEEWRIVILSICGWRVEEFWECPVKKCGAPPDNPKDFDLSRDDCSSLKFADLYLRTCTIPLKP